MFACFLFVVSAESCQRPCIDSDQNTWHDFGLDSQAVIPSLQETADFCLSMDPSPLSVIDLKLQLLLGCRSCTCVLGMWEVKLSGDSLLWICSILLQLSLWQRLDLSRFTPCVKWVKCMPEPNWVTLKIETAHSLEMSVSAEDPAWCQNAWHWACVASYCLNVLCSQNRCHIIIIIIIIQDLGSCSMYWCVKHGWFTFSFEKWFKHAAVTVLRERHEPHESLYKHWAVWKYRGLWG